ncbi:hypothetical protein P8452_75050 [Trifolium repens]|nr:hypothetical protein P8452_75050 [Trifolium repens]
MKKETFFEESVDLGKRKREVFEKDSQVPEKDGLEMLSDALGEQTENVLQSGTSVESLPSLPASFATLDSFCSSTATAAAAHENVAKYLGPDLNQPGPSEMPSPAKKPKMETDMAKMFKMLTYVMMEFKIMREWIATTVCPHLNVTAPPPNPSPAIDSKTSTSSDDSSPTSPK